MNEQDYIDIEVWLQGDMEPVRAATFQQRLTEDPKFAAALAEREELNAHLRAGVGEADFRQTIKDAMGGKAGEAKVMPLQPPAKKVKWMQLLGAAATVLLLILAFQLFSDGGGSDLDQFSDHAPLALVERGTGTNFALEAETEFNSGRYAAAIQPLRDYLAGQDSNIQAKLALAISLMETDDSAGAEQLFTEISQGTSVLSGYGTWYLALLSVRKGDSAAALRYLDLLPPGDEFLKEKARKLRESL